MKPGLGILGLLFALGLTSRGADAWTLERAIRHALTNSPDARIAQQRIAAAQAGLTQARSAFSPQLQFQSSYLRTDNPMLAFGSILNQQALCGWQKRCRSRCSEGQRSRDLRGGHRNSQLTYL
jgi:outer membrane protein TolC